MPRSSRKEKLAQYVQHQKDWVKEQGLSQAGYVERYKEFGHPEVLGEGGSAIFAADVSALAVDIGRLRKAEGRKGPELQKDDVFDAFLFASDAPQQLKDREEARQVKIIELYSMKPLESCSTR